MKSIGECNRYLTIRKVTLVREPTTGQVTESVANVGNLWADVEEFSSQEAEVNNVVRTQVSGTITGLGLIQNLTAKDYLFDPVTDEEWEIQGVRYDRAAQQTIIEVVKYQEEP